MNKTLMMTLLSLSILHTSLARSPLQRNGRQDGFKPLKTRAEFDRKAKATSPTVIMFTSSTCSACDSLKDALAPVIKMYPQVEYYTVDVSSRPFKGITKELNLPAYPTTYFITKGLKRHELRGYGNTSKTDSENVIKELLFLEKEASH